MTETRPPFHYGGPLGLGALVAVAGAAGVYLYTNSGPDIAVESDHPIPVVVTSAEPVKVTIDTQPKPTTEAEPDIVTVEKTTPPMLKKIETPRPSPSTKPLVRTPSSPKPKPRIETLPAQAKGVEVTFIVRIKGSDDIDQAARLFKKDRPEAIRAFSHYAETAPAFKDFKLVGGSYSGEIRLAYTLPPGTKPDRATINKIKNKIMSVDGVSYADPDFVAHPGKE